MWMIPKWRNIDVISRQYCPSAINGGNEAPRSTIVWAPGPLNSDAGPPAATSTANIPRSATRITWVTEAVRARRRTVSAGLRRKSRRAWPTHSGHWWPTDAGIMHSGQIGRPHRVQWTRVSTLGCR
jgi:hypothetical protein